MRRLMFYRQENYYIILLLYSVRSSSLFKKK